MPAGHHRRFSVIRWVSWNVYLGTRRLATRLRKLLCGGCSVVKDDRGAHSSSPHNASPLTSLVVTCLPVSAAVIVFPRQWFLNAAALAAVEIFLYWVLIVTLRSTNWIVRRVVGAIVFSGIIVDSMLLADYFQKHQIAGRSLSVDGFGMILLALTAFWLVGTLWIFLSRTKGRIRRVNSTVSNATREIVSSPGSIPELRVPQFRFADVGGMQEPKQRIREVVESRLNPDKYAAYGVVRNGILLYGPRGSGKTFLAEATAGEFGLNFHYISPTRFVTMGLGVSEAGIREAFMRVLANRPALLFIDEIDALGSARQSLGGSGDPGGAGRSYNNMTIELMQSIDRARNEPGFVVMAATNVIDGLDEALVREGRFDVKIHVDLPDEATRERIFEAQLAGKPWARFDLKSFARRTPGASAAKVRALVDQAALSAARDRRKIEPGDLEKALQEYGGKDRPLFQPADWNDLVIDGRIEQELRSLIRLVGNPFAAERIGLEVPMGVLLLGPPGTGKTLIARLIATQSKRSFFPITSAEITEPKAVSRVFTRAKENSPSLIFIDEMDSLLPANRGYLSQYYIQIVEQFLIEISNLQPENNVFLVGTTNHPESIDARVLRGGRFSEKIEIGLPGREEVGRLLAKYLKGVELEPPLASDYLSEWLAGTTPANLEAMVATAKRYAYERSSDDKLAPLRLDDFERAATRVMGQPPPPPSVRSTPV